MHPVINREREDGNAVESRTIRHEPTGRDTPDRRLDADDAVEAGGNASGATGVGPEREGDKACPHNDRRTGTRAARYIQRIADRPTRSIRRSCSGKAGGELIEIGLAEANRARGEQQLDAACRAFRSVAKCRACRRGGHPRYVDIVFHSERHAVKRQAFSGSGLRFNFGARTQRLFARPEVNPSWPDRGAANAVVNRCNQLARPRTNGVGLAQIGQR